MAKRSRDRPTIARFVEYLRVRGVDRRPEIGDRMAHIERVAAAFPEAHLADQIARERAREERALAAAAKFSGDLVRRLRPGLEGKELGAFIVAFKRSVVGDGDGHAFEEFVLATPADEIERRIRELET